MNLLDVISEATKYNLGWTLIHSLWIGTSIFLVIKFLNKTIPAKYSSLKYIINCGGLLVLLSASIGTFLYLNTTNGPSSELITGSSLNTNLNVLFQKTQVQQWSTWVVHINQQMPWIVAGWMVGVFIFSLRFLSGLLYIRYLRSTVSSVSDFWNSKLFALSNHIGLGRFVALAESCHISKPIVVGYVKPMIILPIGLLSGLPFDQVEAILVHELAHIKRHDYLINIIQSLIEILLFFNPFVWMISKMIREERENCCDDYVIDSGSSRINYIKALANLESARLSHTPSLALALNKNKYQVFNRIKRIMETSVNKQQGKMRPIALLAIILTALICASWLTVGTKNEREKAISKTGASNIFIPADTAIDKNNLKKDEKDNKETSASYSRQTIITYDKDGTPHEEVIESFEGDESMRHMFSDSTSYSFHMPNVPHFPDFPSIPGVPPTPFDHSFSYSFDGDTIPGNHFFSEEDADRWEEFAREMANRFEHFGSDNEEFANKWENWGRQFENNFSYEFNERLQEQMERLQEKLQDLNNNKEFKDKLEFSLKEMELQLEKLEQTLKAHKNEFRHMEEDMEQYENELSDQLYKDGYLKKGEEVKSMSWGDGKLTVNGIKIKDKDLPKYEALNKKYFKGKRGYYIPD